MNSWQKLYLERLPRALKEFVMLWLADEVKPKTTCEEAVIAALQELGKL